MRDREKVLLRLSTALSWKQLNEGQSKDGFARNPVGKVLTQWFETAMKPEYLGADVEADRTDQTLISFFLRPD